MLFKDVPNVTMDAGQWFLSFFKDFVGTPAILVGIFAMFGAILLRKKATEIITAFFKTAAGFFIISGGAGVLVGSLSNFQLLFEDLFKISGSIPNNEALAGTVMQIAGSIAQLGSIVMVLSIVLNIALAWGSRFKFVYLSGHVLFYLSIALASVMVLSGFDVNQPGDYAIALISSAIIMSLYMVLSCAMLFRWTKMITKSNEISIAHTGALSYAMGGLIGELIYKIKKGENIRSTEDIKFPKGLQFFRNTFISMAITMIIVFLIVYIPEGIMYNAGIKTIDPKLPQDKIDALNNLFGSGSTNWLVRAITEGFTFAAGVEIILLGVRMVIGELVPSFKGISEKVIKDAKAGVDCPIVFPYAPNGVLIGFLCSFIGAGVGLGISIGISAATKGSVNVIPVIIPGIVAQFFLGATTAVFANARGGILAAVIASFLNGIIITLSPIVFYAAGWVPKDQETGIAASSIWGDTDYLLAAFPGLLVLPEDPTVKRVLVMLVPSLIWIGLIIDGQIKFFKDKKGKQQLEVQAMNSSESEAEVAKDEAADSNANEDSTQAESNSSETNNNNDQPAEMEPEPEIAKISKKYLLI